MSVNVRELTDKDLYSRILEFRRLMHKMDIWSPVWDEASDKTNEAEAELFSRLANAEKMQESKGAAMKVQMIYSSQHGAAMYIDGKLALSTQVGCLSAPDIVSLITGEYPECVNVEHKGPKYVWPGENEELAKHLEKSGFPHEWPNNLIGGTERTQEDE